MTKGGKGERSRGGVNKCDRESEGHDSRGGRKDSNPTGSRCVVAYGHKGYSFEGLAATEGVGNMIPTRRVSSFTIYRKFFKGRHDVEDNGNIDRRSDAERSEGGATRTHRTEDAVVRALGVSAGGDARQMAQPGRVTACHALEEDSETIRRGVCV